MNVLLVCVDDLRPDLGSYGNAAVVSPNLDRLARRSRQFNHHYVQAPTCGASRAALLTGRYGDETNAALFRRAEQMANHPNAVSPSLPEWFRDHGYTTVSVGKVSHHPGGRGGPDWNDDALPEMPGAWDRHLMPSGPWQHPRGAMHGLAKGQQRRDDQRMPVTQACPGDDLLYPDGWIRRTAVEELRHLAADSDRPFFLAVGFIRPHLPFGVPDEYLRIYDDLVLPPIVTPESPNHRSTWHPSAELHRYDVGEADVTADSATADQLRRHYLAGVSYVDAQIGHVLDALEASGLADSTIIVFWSDHGWHLGEHAIWGKHTLFEWSLRTPLMISSPGLEAPGTASDSIVETIDLYPTLCDLAGLRRPEFTHGESLRPMLENPEASGNSAVSYFEGVRTIRTATHRLIVHADGYLELYDHTVDPNETTNLADERPDVAALLQRQLDDSLGMRPN